MRLKRDNLDCKSCPGFSCINYATALITIVISISSVVKSFEEDPTTWRTVTRTATSSSFVGGKLFSEHPGSSSKRRISTNDSISNGRTSTTDNGSHGRNSMTDNGSNRKNSTIDNGTHRRNTTIDNGSNRKNSTIDHSGNREKNQKPALDKKLIIIIAVIAGSVITVAVLIVAIYYKCKSNPKKKKTLLVQKTKKVTVQWQYSTYGNFAEPVKIPVVKIEEHLCCDSKCDLSVDYEMPTDIEWEFPRDNLEFVNTIGEGSFGEVKLAKAFETSQVAVKMLKNIYTNDDLIDLVQEMELMKMIGKHKNVLELVGCCTQNGPLYVITAYAPHGNFLDFLRKHGVENNKRELGLSIPTTLKASLLPKDLISFAHQIAQGMEHLELKRFIHRDLAACNVLVSDHYVMKIADFGLIRDFGWNDYYRKTKNGRLPVKWMAPEALLHRKYSIQSDVWSFGILLWEIMTLGGTPYPSITKIEQLHPLIQNGYRMDKPANCPTKVYQIMTNCWANEAKSRPTFSQLVGQLDKILTKIKSAKHKSTHTENRLVHNPLYACVDISHSTFSLCVDDDN